MRDKHVIQILKTNSQLLETDLQTPPLIFFRNQFLKAIARNQFFYKNSMDPKPKDHA
jgi:hypothetical protein